MRLPALACDYFKLTATKGRVTGESLRDFPIREGDHLLADRGYSTAAGTGCATQAGGRVTVRVNTGALAFPAGDGAPFDLLGEVSSLETAGDEQSWPVRKTEEAIRIAQEGIRKEARRKGRQVRPQTLEFARHVIVFATFPAADFSRAEVLEWHRLRCTSSWRSSASSNWRTWETCRSTTTRAPRRGSTESCSRRCWWRS